MAHHMAYMKSKAIAESIGHFDNDIDMAGVEAYPGIMKMEVKPHAVKSVRSIDN